MILQWLLFLFLNLRLGLFLIVAGIKDQGPPDIVDNTFQIIGGTRQ